MYFYKKYTNYNIYIYNSNFYKNYKNTNTNLFLYTFNFKKISISFRLINFIILINNLYINYNFYMCIFHKIKYLYLNFFFINLILNKFFSFLINLYY
jgi:hypothetical protein